MKNQKRITKTRQFLSKNNRSPKEHIKIIMIKKLKISKNKQTISDLMNRTKQKILIKKFQRKKQLLLKLFKRKRIPRNLYKISKKNLLTKPKNYL